MPELELKLQSDFYFNEEIVTNILKFFWPKMDSKISIKKLIDGKSLYLRFNRSKEELKDMIEDLNRVGVKVMKRDRLDSYPISNFY